MNSQSCRIADLHKWKSRSRPLLSRRAWHAGESTWRERSRCNDFSIGIELEGTDTRPYTAAQYRTLGRLARALIRRYQIADVVGHSDVAPGRKTDPGPRFDWARLGRRVGAPKRARIGVRDEASERSSDRPRKVAEGSRIAV